MDGEAVFAANTDLNSLTLPQTLSQGLFPGPGAASEAALDKWSRSSSWKSLWLYIMGGVLEKESKKINSSENYSCEIFVGSP